jgi:hypothetical protein
MRQLVVSTTEVGKTAGRRTLGMNGREQRRQEHFRQAQHPRGERVRRQGQASTWTRRSFAIRRLSTEKIQVLTCQHTNIQERKAEHQSKAHSGKSVWQYGRLDKEWAR